MEENRYRETGEDRQHTEDILAVGEAPVHRSQPSHPVSPERSDHSQAQQAND